MDIKNKPNRTYTLSILLPTYNEKGNIIPLLKSIKENLKEYKKEIIVVDDSSPDGTADLVKEFSKNNQEVRCIVRKSKQGLASAFINGINASSGDLIVIMDADLSHPPSVIPKLLKYIDDYDIVAASRYIKGGKMLTNNKVQFIYSTIFNMFVQKLLDIPFTDSTNGFFVAKRKIFHNLNLEKIFDGFGEFHFKLAYHLKNKITVKEIPFTYEKRKRGMSKNSPVKHGFSYVMEALKLKFGSV